MQIYSGVATRSVYLLDGSHLTQLIDNEPVTANNIGAAELTFKLVISHGVHAIG